MPGKLLKNKIEGKQIGGKPVDSKPTLYLFKASWCGHCKNFIPTWEALEKRYTDKINLIAYDVDKNKKEIEEWNIESFPTLFYRKGLNAIEYNGDRSIDDLIKFIESN